MKKIKLYGIGNEGNFNHYIFDKEQDVADEIAEIFKEIFNLTWNFYEEYKTKKGKWVNKKINIETLKDTHEMISSGNNFRVDVFYGGKKMFITIHCSQKNRLRFNEELFKIALMSKPKVNRKIK